MIKTKSLYIHIPFCKSICTYCDFFRIKKDENMIWQFLIKIVKQIKRNYINHQFKTIYIGGGTPNCLNNEQLDFLLSNLKPKLSKKYEFTIECNLDLITISQIAIFKRNKINRISVGIQTTNNLLLKKLNRNYTKKEIIDKVILLKKYHINNISFDFIYGFNEMKIIDIKKSIDLSLDLEIKHLSFYALEIKENSQLAKKQYTLSDTVIERHLKFIDKYLKLKKYHKYEVSNWAKSEKNYSKHNINYWKSNNWTCLGPSAYGFENNIYYYYTNDILNFTKTLVKYSLADLYQHILLMGLRLKKGINLNIKINYDAYTFFKNQLFKSKLIKIKNNYLYCTNLNLLDEALINLVV